MPNLIGSGPDQISVNGMLGSLAFQDALNPTVGRIAVGFGPTANFIRFPNAQAVVSTANSSGTGVAVTETHNIGLLAEGTASFTDATVYGIGVYGVGYSANTTRSTGVVGESHVTTSADTGTAIGVRGYSTDTHSGGQNIGLYTDAYNSSIGNYALYMNSGNIYSGNNQVWTTPGVAVTSNFYANTTVSVQSSSTTITINQILSRIISCNSATAITFTLPTGTNCDTGIISGTSPVNSSHEWSIVNLGSASGAITIAAGTAHTYFGNSTVSIASSARFSTLKTATNTFQTWRIS